MTIIQSPRYSTTLFEYQKWIVEAQEELVNDEYPLQFKHFHHLDYIEYSMKNKLVSLVKKIQAYAGV